MTIKPICLLADYASVLNSLMSSRFGWLRGANRSTNPDNFSPTLKSTATAGGGLDVWLPESERNRSARISFAIYRPNTRITYNGARKRRFAPLHWKAGNRILVKPFDEGGGGGERLFLALCVARFASGMTSQLVRL